MGLFNWRKKDAPDGTSAQNRPPPNMDELVAAAHEKDASALAALRSAVLSLTQWHFIVEGHPELRPSSIPTPFCVVVDGRPTLCAFTSEQRVTDFAMARKFEQGYAIMTIPMPGAVGIAIACESEGVVDVVFDEGVGGGYLVGLPNLVGLYAERIGLGLVEAAERCGADPAKSLEGRFAISQSSQHLREFVEWACEQPAWWVLADPASPGRPRVWAGALDGKQTAAIFSSEARACEDSARMKGSPASGGPSLLQYPRAEYPKLIERLRYEGGVDVIAINMRVPVAPKGLSDLIAARPK